MTADNKKILMYVGIPLVLGGVAFFVWSFFKKEEIPFDNTVVKFGEEEIEQNTDTNTGNSLFSNLPTTFSPIEVPNIANDLEILLHGR